MWYWQYRKHWGLPRPTKEYVEAYKSEFRLYRICYYRLYRVCPWCGCEYDCALYSVCPSSANGNPGNPPEPGFVFFPELLVETSSLSLFPELAFEP